MSKIKKSFSACKDCEYYKNRARRSMCDDCSPAEDVMAETYRDARKAHGKSRYERKQKYKNRKYS